MQSIRFTLNLDFRKVNPIYKAPDIEEGIEVKECRICLESGEEQINPLLNVCGCKGSTKYVHKECIEKWINMHSKNHENHNKCQICKQDFNMDPYRKRLIYKATHRGMRETDKLIGSFALARIVSFSNRELTSFDRLLDESDNDLLNWIMRREEAPTRVDSKLITQIILFNNDQ